MLETIVLLFYNYESLIRLRSFRTAPVDGFWFGREKNDPMTSVDTSVRRHVCVPPFKIFAALSLCSRCALAPLAGSRSRPLARCPGAAASGCDPRFRVCCAASRTRTLGRGVARAAATCLPHPPVSRRCRGPRPAASPRVPVRLPLSLPRSAAETSKVMIW